MTRGEVQTEVDRTPFLPFRLHLVSGKTLDVRQAHEAWMLRHSVLLIRRKPSGGESENIVSFFNIERLERLER